MFSRNPFAWAGIGEVRLRLFGVKRKNVILETLDDRRGRFKRNSIFLEFAKIFKMKINVFKFSVLSFFLMGALTACGPKEGESSAASVPVPAGIPVSGLRIATVNMDSINAGFQMVADVQNELSRTEKRLTDDIQRQAADFQTEYENYLKIGATLTLSEQKKRESDLEQKQQNIAGLQQTYANQIVSLQAQRMEEVTKTILDYVEKYNKENGSYTMVVITGRNSGVLYSEPSMDITRPVIDGLNREYRESKKTK